MGSRPTGQPEAASSALDDDGIRVLLRQRSARLGAWPLLAAAIAVGAGVALGLWWGVTAPPQVPARATASSSQEAPGARPDAFAPEPSFTVARVAPRPRPLPEPGAESPEDYDLPSLDPDDIAAYYRPGDEVPTAGELIDALRDAGIREGLAAFNPPGTSPPLEGLAVPEDYPLPEGYVRHHQVTDEGVPIEPILMFSPDYEFYDEHGQPIALPPDRVVPEALAPPDLPIRHVRLPPP